MRKSLYRLLLTGIDIATHGHEEVKRTIENWAADCGVRNVTSGVIRCDANELSDHMLYSAHFDSSHWTGRDFEGFHVKNIGEPVTDFP